MEKGEVECVSKHHRGRIVLLRISQLQLIRSTTDKYSYIHKATTFHMFISHYSPCPNLQLPLNSYPSDTANTPLKNLGTNDAYHLHP